MKFSFLMCVIVFLLSGCGESKHHNSSDSLSRSPPPSPAQYRHELEVIRRGKLQRRRVLNKKEEEVYWELVDYCSQNELKLFAQVSLGEILSSKGEEYRYVNSKRVDFCIADKRFFPVAVIEYQGSGHQNETSDERDAVKRAAVESAGIQYIAVDVGRERFVQDALQRAGI